MFDEFEEKPEPTKNWDQYSAIVRRRRWWLVLPGFVVWCAVWGTSWFLPASYKSETLILVEQQKVPELYVVPNVATDLQDRLQSMTQQILSRTRLERIIDEFHLYGDEKSRLSPDEIVDKMRQDIQIDLVQAPGRQNDLTAFRISYSSKDPHLAQRVTSELTSLFIDDNMKARSQQSESTTDFLQNQLEEAAKALNEQEKHVREFKDKYLGELPSQLQSNVQILSGLQSRLQGETEALNQSKQQNLYLRTLLNQYHEMRGAIKNGTSEKEAPPPALDQELTRLRNQLADVQSRYTERHPDYRKLKDRIAKVEKMKQQMAADLEAAASTQTGKDSNSKAGDATDKPANLADLKAMSPMMEVESQLKANELELQNRQKVIDQLETQIQDHQARINQTPVREQQLSDLTRDYEQSRTNYESLLSKRNQSELATSLEKRQQGEQFRIIDPPSLPLKPYKPDRLLFGFVGLLAGVLVGLAVSAGAELVDDRVFAEADLKELVSAPVLTEIPPLTTPLELIRHRWRVRLEWMGAAIIVLVTAGGLMFTYYHG